MLADVSQLLPLLAGYTVAELPHDSSVEELDKLRDEASLLWSIVFGLYG